LIDADPCNDVSPGFIGACDKVRYDTSLLIIELI